MTTPARIVVADPLHEAGLRLLEASGAELVQVGAGEKERLPALLGDADALVVRSGTKVTAELLRAGKRLRVVGRAGIGVDNVDVEAATALGVLVVNAPTANLIAATEHTWALLLALARNVAAADAAMKREEWDRKRFLGRELQGKILGVVGFGRIGQQVARRAHSFDMQVVAYDPFLDSSVAERWDVELAALDDVLSRADVVTLHTPLTEQTRNLIDAAALARMRPGALLVNCARGGVVDEEALLAALDEGRLGGAALDVFAVEPPQSWRLACHPRVVATPHIGAQTKEAQERVATETARMVLAALDGSLAVTAVNLPFTDAGAHGEPYLRLGEQLGRLASTLLGGSLKRVEVGLWGLEDELRVPVSVAVLRGALLSFLGEAVNYVNAEGVAASRGIEVVRATHRGGSDYPHLVEVRLAGEAGEVELAGSLLRERDPRVVRFRGFPLEFKPSGLLLVVVNQDVPGVVGKLGTLLGQAKVNIADIHLARRRGTDEAMAVLRLDQEPPADALEALRALPEVEEARVIDLRTAQGARE
ncbi:MAG: phosphoglycerate dehydrogenase [Thermoanaerobaculia bacterium]